MLGLTLIKLQICCLRWGLNQRSLDAQVIVLWNDKPQNKRKVLLEGGLVDLTDTHSQNEVSV